MSNVTSPVAAAIPTISATIPSSRADYKTELIKLVQCKFKENDEKVIDAFEAYEIKDSDEPRILALVGCKSGGTYGVFAISALQLPPRHSNELTIKQVFALDSSFQMRLRSDVVSMLNFELRCSDEEPTVFYYYPTDSSSRVTDFYSFQSQILTYKGTTDLKKLDPIQVAENCPLNFNWISDYRKIGEMKQELKRREHEYIEFKNFTIYCATWNVNNKVNYLDPLPGWLSAYDMQPDIFAIALQELDTSTRATALGEDRCDMQWIERMLNNIPSRHEYEELKSVRLVGMMLTIIIRKDLRERAHISQCQIKSIPRGILNTLGNKGGVAVRLQLNEDTICFVNSHLAAHLRAVKERNDDYTSIVQNLIFDNVIKLDDHDHIFWIGDLNYRIEEGISLPFNNYDPDSYKVLLQHDQLLKEMRQQNCFNGYKEGEITFRPTYKYDTGTDNYDSSEKQRSPAYCDRILWKGKRIELMCYNSVMEIRESDHKPVYAIFKVQIKTRDDVKFKRVHNELLKLVDKHENDNKPQLTVDVETIYFGTVLFNELTNRDFKVSNICSNKVEFKFNEKSNSPRICEKWIRVQPEKATLLQDATKSIRVSMRICKTNVREFLEKLSTAGEKVFDFDILVLNVVGGNHLFITVTGEYKPSCFGLSVETLCRTDRPLCDYTQKQFKELLVNRSERFQATMPREIYMLIDYLFKKGADARGVFKKSNFSLSERMEFSAVRDWLDTWADDEFPGTPQVAAEALIMLLELPQEPMLAPYVDELLWKTSCDAAMECISQLSSPKRNVFVHLTLFLREGIEKDYHNLHDVSSLFGSVLLRSSNAEAAKSFMKLILCSDMGAVSNATKQKQSAMQIPVPLANGNTAITHDLL